MINVIGSPDISINPDYVDFGDVIIGNTANFDIEISNDGTLPLEIFSISINSGDNFSVENSTLIIEPGDSYITSISYTPDIVGSDAGELLVVSDDPNEQEYSISFSGNGTPTPQFSLSDVSIVVDINSFEVDLDTLTLTNSGEGILEYQLDIIGGVSETVSFAKENYADWNLSENQDRITDEIWLTRGDQYPLFNAYSQSPDQHESPEGTEWAYGYTAEVINEYGGFRQLHQEYMNPWNGDNNNIVTFSMHIIGTDRYFDITFDSWTSGNNGEGGGGFSYSRQEVSSSSWLTLIQSNLGEVSFEKEVRLLMVRNLKITV